MSLFQLKSWWDLPSRSKVGANRCRLYDASSMCVLEDGGPGARGELPNLIAFGGLDGILRVAVPDPTGRCNLPGGVLLELDLQKPILQIDYGFFIRNSKSKALALLHPNHLSIARIALLPDPTAGMSVQGEMPTLADRCHFAVEYEITLSSPSFNMVYGPFGRVSDKDLICIQSLDGIWTVVDGGSVGFVRKLPDFILPGSLCYIPTTDSIVTYSSTMAVESYRYHHIAIADEVPAIQPGDKRPTTPWASAKRLKPDWSFIVMDTVVDILITRTELCIDDQAEIAVVGYLGAPDEKGIPKHYLAIGTHSGLLMIYHGTCLIWMARMDTIPASIRIGSFWDTRNLIVHLNDMGDLCVAYLGTRKSPMSLDQDTPVVVSDENILELRKVHRDLEAATSDSGKRLSKAATFLDVQHELHITCEPENSLLDGGDTGWIRRARCVVKVSNLGSVCVTEIRASVATVFFMRITDVVEPALDLDPECSCEMAFSLALESDGLYGGQPIQVLLTFSVATQPDRLIGQRYDIDLPITIGGSFCAADPDESAMTEVVFETDYGHQVLPALYEGDTSKEHHALLEGGCITFRHWNGVVVCINAQRKGFLSFRSESLDALALPIRGLWKQFYRQSIADPPHFSIKELPMPAYSSVINLHIAARAVASRSRQELENTAALYRITQKRLLIRVKDTAPSSIDHLALVLDTLYDSMRQDMTACSRAEKNLDTLRQKLSNATMCMCVLIGIYAELDAVTQASLFSALSCHVPANEDAVGWEENTYASIISMAKEISSKFREQYAPSHSLHERAENATKLETSITKLSERLRKLSVRRKRASEV
ncbi:PTHB1 N-terminus-domain-containing protein [Polychytrium aggregatum]|uniref:PTHB1 N-terminus-domain-containing protein n=1 Tax=Polychytrium aggregatum TaxID=110093 RepID=UPI0022FDBD74|nr:PTHB1 N-terminus-domain-containing protein [Polychytrium aggregatum]KAI9209277.1 PTHB1 N-terminus-domain-containing protein [Polychytrium aggregatum]